MNYLDLTFPTPSENLACDEALLEQGGQSIGGTEVLRFWEPQEHFVVLGYANKARLEVNFEACRKRRIPILRRCSGGGTVLQGPGCLNYSLILKISENSPLRSISQTNCFIMKQNAEALACLLGQRIEIQGFTDLAIDNLKISGNAQRRKQEWLLFHGTFLLDFEIGLMEELLLFPSRQPAYRQNRSHAQFLSRVQLSAHSIKTALRECWKAREPLVEFSICGIKELACEKYAKDEWNLKW